MCSRDGMARFCKFVSNRSVQMTFLKLRCWQKGWLADAVNRSADLKMETVNRLFKNRVNSIGIILILIG